MTPILNLDRTDKEYDQNLPVDRPLIKRQEYPLPPVEFLTSF